MLRSVGAGERATAPGHPVAVSNDRPYRDLKSPGLGVRYVEPSSPVRKVEFKLIQISITSERQNGSSSRGNSRLITSLSRTLGAFLYVTSSNRG